MLIELLKLIIASVQRGKVSWSRSFEKRHIQLTLLLTRFNTRSWSTPSECILLQ